MSEARPPSPPHSTDGDRNKDLGPQQTLPASFTPPMNMSTPLAMPEFVSDPLDFLFLDNDLPNQAQYDDPSLYHTAAGPQYYDERPMYYPAPPRQYTPTPPPAGYVDSGIHTRSGRALRSPETPKRVGRSLPTKRQPKRRVGKAPKAGPHNNLEAPLSKLTEEYTIPVKDMDAWVNRSSEDRRKESEKKNGYISRPMNSFMLYRSAYAERVKQYCKENNHQVVSQVTGASWPMEPDRIRKRYEQYAIVERDNHQAAFPDYKFAPNKNGKKRGRDEGEEDSDGEWGGSSRTKRSRTAVSSRRGDTPRSGTGTPSNDYYSPSPYQPAAIAYNPSSWDFQYPATQPPQMFVDAHGQYFHHTIRAPPQYANRVEDVQFHQMDNTFPPQDQMLNALAVLPSHDGQQLLNSAQDHVAMPALDPQLNGNFPLPDLNNLDGQFTSPRQADFGAAQAFHPGEATLTDGHNLWEDQGQFGNDFDQELRRL